MIEWDRTLKTSIHTGLKSLTPFINSTIHSPLQQARSNPQVHDSTAGCSRLRLCTVRPHLHTVLTWLPCGYFLFRNLKSHLHGVRYPDDEALKEAVKEWLEGQTEEFYFSGINSLPEKCRKCIELSGDYIDK